MKAVTSWLGLMTVMAGCSLQHPQRHIDPLLPAAVTNPASKPSAIPPDPLAALPPAIREAVVDGNLRTLHEGITTLLPYNPHGQPVINCQVLRVTEIVLAPGETVRNDGSSAGDTERWDIRPVEGRVLVKPKEAGIATDLIIVTDQRSYHFTLRTRSPYMAQVAFYYPDDLKGALATRQAALRQAATQVVNPPPSQPLNFNYRIAGPDVTWKPLAVFDDGAHTYVQFPESTAAADMPTLMVRNGSEQALVNYQVHGSYYVADRLFRDAALTSGTGANREVVQISATEQDQ
ncbi:MAG TPA: TrbG/VirB9 family P-type conjugative transfer protein [Candidatus Binataceae bacterium]|nr:TrbG/VirB9 family P-type conjugative transfer protein [Candidatus Binataceae bacterium]